MKKLNRITILMLISITMLLIALLDLPYWYYQVLRWVICWVSWYLALLFYEKDNEKWIWVFWWIAILFNPISTIHLDKELWSIINIIVAVIMIYNIKALKPNTKLWSR